ncbi:MAG: sterol desaturase family protein, partial [Litoreibacter sp.]|nr:sterol desaturase family protein [Litoreibacter sp.]
MPSDASFAQDPEADRWHYRPADPVALNPLFTWPLNLKSVFDWYRGAWLQITSVSICFILALAVWFIFIPPLEAMQSFAPGWMARVWLANLLPQILVAGTLHWWLYMRKGQGTEKKFEARDPTRMSGHFSFGNQVRDNVFWTLGSAITVATIYQWVIFWCMANSYVPTVTFAENPVWCGIW